MVLPITKQRESYSYLKIFSSTDTACWICARLISDMHCCTVCKLELKSAFGGTTNVPDGILVKHLFIKQNKNIF